MLERTTPAPKPAAMVELFIANKNYSSWSLRPWVLLKELKIPFVEHLVPFGDVSGWETYRRISPSGKVPCLIDGDTVVWDSLAIAEYLAEPHPRVWPDGREARAWARSASAEMHSGFDELRSRCSMSCGVRLALKEFPPSLQRDLTRLSTLWNEGLRRFGGPYLAGPAFTAVDAFFAPVAFRIQTYGLSLDPPAIAYAALLRDLPAMQDWYADALKERFRDAPHEAEMLDRTIVLEDRRER